jgi:hypothetical protein
VRDEREAAFERARRRAVVHRHHVGAALVEAPDALPAEPDGAWSGVVAVVAEGAEGTIVVRCASCGPAVVAHPELLAEIVELAVAGRGGLAQFLHHAAELDLDRHAPRLVDAVFAAR